MARNVEVKARVASIAALEPRVAALADQGPITITQDDTFFPCQAGRLKLRAFSESAGELIFYERSDTAEPKPSRYVIAPTAAPAALREALSRAYGTAGRVRKRRTLYLAGRTRIHLDCVDELGEFLELEVVLASGEDVAPGIAEAEHLLAALGIGAEALIDRAYVDLLAEAQGT